MAAERGLFDTAGISVQSGPPESVLYGAPVDALFARGIRTPPLTQGGPL